MLWVPRQLSNVDKRLFRNQLDPLDVGAVDKDRGWTPLHFAVARCRFDVAGLLVAFGASVLGTAGGAAGAASAVATGGVGGLLAPAIDTPIVPVIDVLPTAPPNGRVSKLQSPGRCFFARLCASW